MSDQARERYTYQLKELTKQAVPGSPRARPLRLLLTHLARSRSLSPHYNPNRHKEVLPLRVRALLVGEPGTRCAGMMQDPNAEKTAHRLDRREAAITCTFIQALRDISPPIRSFLVALQR